MDRLACSGGTTVAKGMAREPISGSHEVEVRDDKGRVSIARVDLRFCQMTIHPPIGKQNRYPSLRLTVIDAQERGKPKGRQPIHWKLLTDLPVPDLAASVEKLDWYAMRWKIETYHKVLKSGCQAEQSDCVQRRRLTNLLAVLCVVGWRVFWLTMSTARTRRFARRIDRARDQCWTGWPKPGPQRLGYRLQCERSLTTSTRLPNSVATWTGPMIRHPATWSSARTHKTHRHSPRL